MGVMPNSLITRRDHYIPSLGYVILISEIRTDPRAGIVRGDSSTQDNLQYLLEGETRRSAGENARDAIEV